MADPKIRRIAALVGVLLLGSFARAQNAPKGAPPKGEKVVEGNPDGGLPYRVHLPETAGAKKPCRLVVWLHPSGGSGNDMVERMAPLFLKHGYALLVITNKPWAAWTSEEGQKLLEKTLPDAGKIPGLTATKPYLMGFSAGGQMALEFYWADCSKFGGLVLDAAYPIDLSTYAQGRAEPHALPKDSAILKVPFFVLVGDQDGGAQLWKKVEPTWSQARIPLTIRYVAGRRHEWLFGGAETDALEQWLREIVAGKLPGQAPEKKP
jgi:predicted esterase